MFERDLSVAGRLAAARFGTCDGDRSCLHGHRLPPNPPATQNKGSQVMIRTAVISVIASFVLVGAWTVNLVSYHPATATDLDPLAPLSTNVD